MAQSTIQTAVWLKLILRIAWGPWHTQAKHRRQVKSKLKVQTSSWRVFHTFFTCVCVLDVGKRYLPVNELSTDLPRRAPCLDAWWATRNEMSKKHKIKVNKAVSTWWKMQAPTTIFSASSLSGENCHEKTTSFPFLPTKILPDTLPGCLSPPQKGNLCLALLQHSKLHLSPSLPMNHEIQPIKKKKQNAEAPNLISVIEHC